MRHLLEIPDYNLYAFRPEAGRMRLYGKSDPPPAPDYTGAAKATADGNLEAAKYAADTNAGIAGMTADRNQQLAEYAAQQNQEFARNQTKANRANQVNQDGSLTWTHTGDDPDAGWTQTQSLNAGGQALYDKNQAMSSKYADAASAGFDKVKDMLSNPNLDMSDPRLSMSDPRLSMDNIPKRAIDVGQTAQDAIMARLNPQFKNQEADLQTRMANQGITLGSDAYSREMNQFQSGRNDAMSQAALQGIGLDRQNRQDAFTERSGALQERSNALQEMMQLKDRPLNLINALRSGSQVNAPQFGNYSQQQNVTQATPTMNTAQMQTTQGADLFGASKAQYGASMDSYNAGQAQDQALMKGLFGLGSAFISDRRLKKNIKRIGTHLLGIGMYSFDYLYGESSTGVMADEVEKVRPSAIIKHPSGYSMVDYGALL
jgi:Chaperone of endosialidase